VGGSARAPRGTSPCRRGKLTVQSQISRLALPLGGRIHGRSLREVPVPAAWYCRCCTSPMLYQRRGRGCRMADDGSTALQPVALQLGAAPHPLRGSLPARTPFDRGPRAEGWRRQGTARISVRVRMDLDGFGARSVGLAAAPYLEAWWRRIGPYASTMTVSSRALPAFGRRRPPADDIESWESDGCGGVVSGNRSMMQ
jgi:hypothetical protein